MANFKTHITASSLLGVAYSAGAYGLFDVPLPTCILAGGLCAVSGMLPDLDSDSSRPLRESVAFAAAVVPMMLIGRLELFQLSREYMVLIGAAVYLLIRFAGAELLRRYTVHRGMFHSLPAVVIVGEVAFLLASGPLELRLYKAGGVSLGYLSHLVLDELASLYWYRGRLRAKRSFGTALKLFSRHWWPNGSAYLKLALFTFLAFKEPAWTKQFFEKQIHAPIHRTAVEVRDRWFR